MTTTAVRQPPPRALPVRRPRSLTHPGAPRPVTPLGLVRPLSPACPDSPAHLQGGPVEAPEVAWEPSPVHLTRRGRFSVTVATLSLVALAVVGFGAAPVAPPQVGVPSSPEQVSPARSGETTVIVRPGETLWSIARRIAPAADPRAVVQRIAERNGLPGGGVLAGQRLVLPTS